MSMEFKDIQANNRQKLVARLIREATSKDDPSEVRPSVRAQLAIELVKEAVGRGTIPPSEARQFAKSLIDSNIVPVGIGTHEAKVFPAEPIVKARQPLVERARQLAKREGVDFDKINLSMQKIGLSFIKRFEDLAGEVIKDYQPFSLTPKDGVAEVISRMEQQEAARQILSGDELRDLSKQDIPMKVFSEVALPNAFFGNILKKWLEQNYTLGSR